MSKKEEKENAMIVINDFAKWMIEKVQSVHYANNKQMALAYENLSNANNKLTKVKKK